MSSENTLSYSQGASATPLLGETAKAGIILVTINPAYRSRELSYALRQSGVRVLVSAERFRSSASPT